MKNRLLLFFLILCPPILFAQKKKTNKEQRKTELAIGTISIQNLGFITQGFTLCYSNDSLRKVYAQQKKKLFKGVHNKNFCVTIDHGPYDFKENNSFSFFFKIIKPVGKYEFDKLIIFKNSAYMLSNTFFSINIPFEIIENKVTYIGDILIDEQGSIVSIDNKFERDSAKLVKRYPELNVANGK